MKYVFGSYEIYDMKEFFFWFDFVFNFGRYNVFKKYLSNMFVDVMI